MNVHDQIKAINKRLTAIEERQAIQEAQATPYPATWDPAPNLSTDMKTAAMEAIN